MDDKELADARQGEIERILFDDAFLEDALADSDVPRDISKVLVWLYNKGESLINGTPEGIEWDEKMADLCSAVYFAVARYVDKQRSDSIHY